MDRLLDDAGVGEEIFALAAEIYPICRSITGDGVRTTLDHLLRHIALEVYEVPTGTQVFDWTIPREWTVRDAYIKNAAGEDILRRLTPLSGVQEAILQRLGLGAALYEQLEMQNMRS